MEEERYKEKTTKQKFDIKLINRKTGMLYRDNSKIKLQVTSTFRVYLDRKETKLAQMDMNLIRNNVQCDISVFFVNRPPTITLYEQQLTPELRPLVNILLYQIRVISIPATPTVALADENGTILTRRRCNIKNVSKARSSMFLPEKPSKKIKSTFEVKKIKSDNRKKFVQNRDKMYEKYDEILQFGMRNDTSRNHLLDPFHEFVHPIKIGKTYTRIIDAFLNGRKYDKMFYPTERIPTVTDDTKWFKIDDLKKEGFSETLWKEKRYDFLKKIALKFVIKNLDLKTFLGEKNIKVLPVYKSWSYLWLGQTAGKGFNAMGKVWHDIIKVLPRMMRK